MKDLSELDRFETEHLILRKARPDDTEHMLKNVWSDESISNYMLWKPTYTIEEAEDRMKRTMNYQKSAAAYFVCVNYSATSNRASCFNHYCVGYDIHNSASYTVSTGV